MREPNEQMVSICAQCVMDTTDPDIIFDDLGICNHCRERERLIGTLPQTDEAKLLQLNRLVSKIRIAGKRKQYDCLIGVSGGVDSSFLVHKAVELGLRPLLAHFDNGWNSELAVQNINRIVRKLDLDLVTEVADWDEFRSIQRSLFLSGVVDLELLSDQSIIASLFKTARKYGIKYIISGHNVQTETHLPNRWTWLKFDRANLRAIHKALSNEAIKNVPTMGLLSFLIHQKLLGYKFVWPLNNMVYEKARAVALLEQEYDWRPYSIKHGESIITKFYQSYILPKKFGFDKRKSHLSSLVCAGEISREDALAAIRVSPYNDLELSQEIEFFCKKLDISGEEFKTVMEQAPRSHLDFSSEYKLYRFLKKIKRKVYGRKLLNQ